MSPLLRASRRAFGGGPVDLRTIGMAALALVIGVIAAWLAELLSTAISVITNLAFYGRFSTAEASPAENTLGVAVVLVPVAGALVVGLMARFGSSAIRGHGIPEAMEQVLFNQSRIPARILLLKPLSAVVSIGTGGPFGAEGPIIATGGALGSLVGQFAKISADERKTLLAAGAAAGMSATFGSPVAAVLLAVELLLFEYRPRSLIPVMLGSVAAAGVRIAFHGTRSAFVVGELSGSSASSLIGYVFVGAICGVVSVVITRAVYRVEDAFARLPVHWMWWPALGAIPVGVIGIFEPRTMGVGYDNIEQMITGELGGSTLALLCGFKLVSWLFSLGSGTSGGTLAPLFTIGGGLGAAVAGACALSVPSLGVDVRMGALVGMAALFAGASRAPLASAVFAFEATGQSVALLPLLGGCGAAYLISCVMMKNSIMTEKIARRGRPVPSEYSTDHLEQVLVSDVGLREVVTWQSSQTVGQMQDWLRSASSETTHHGFPIVEVTDGREEVIGVITQRNVFASPSREQTLRSLVKRQLIAIAPSETLREAANRMLSEAVGRLPVIEQGHLRGILTRSDLLRGHTSRLIAASHRERSRGPGRRSKS